MNLEQATRLANTVDQHFKELGWSKEDISAGSNWLLVVIALLQNNNLPIYAKKFPEVLRVLANTLDIIIGENKE